MEDITMLALLLRIPLCFPFIVFSTPGFDNIDIHIYDKLSDVAETKVQWRSDFQSGSRVLKKVL